MNSQDYYNKRYARLISIDEIGEKGMGALKNGRVVVIGCGALGSLCAMYLSASGIGTLGIADFDTIDLSNLQRQLFFEESDLGKPKAEVLLKRIQLQNPETNVMIHSLMITKKNAAEIFNGYDFIIDGSDNPSTKLMTASVCEESGKPCCIGGVKGFSGQAMSWKPGCTGYSEIFGDDFDCNGLLPCSVGGVIGPVAGIIASVQACEAIKFIAGAGEMLYDRLFVVDTLNATSGVIAVG